MSLTFRGQSAATKSSSVQTTVDRLQAKKHSGVASGAWTKCTTSTISVVGITLWRYCEVDDQGIGQRGDTGFQMLYDMLAVLLPYSISSNARPLH